MIRDLHLLTAPIDTKGVCFKIRHTPEFHHAKLEPQEDGIFMVHSDVPIHGVAPGQFCVLYDEAHHRCFGSGEITI